MSDLQSMARPAAVNLLALNEDQLYAELGKRLALATTDLNRGSAFAVEGGAESLDTGFLESGIDFGEVGKRFFNNLSLAAYNVVCGTADGHDQLKLVEDQGAAAVTGAITALLIGQLGLMALVAAAVASVIVKTFMKAGLDTLCQTWKSNLPATSQAAPAKG